MKIYPKQSKKDRKTGDFYFGDYGEIPLGFSFVTLNIDQKIADKLHYHEKGREFYFVTEGSGILEVEGVDVELNKESLVMMEPGEKHRIKSVIQAPFSFLAISTVKDRDDKIILED